MRTVVYDNLTRRERKHRHIAVADHLQIAYPDGGAEVVEVIAEHLRQALDADPGAVDAEELRGRAAESYQRSGDRAAALGAPAAAAAAYQQALDLVDDPGVHAELLLRAGETAALSGLVEEGVGLLDQATAELRALGRESEALLSVTAAARALANSGQQAAARARVEVELRALPPDASDWGSTRLLAFIGVNRVINGEMDDTTRDILDRATNLAEGLGDKRLLVDVLKGSAIRHLQLGNLVLARTLSSTALELAREVGDLERVSHLLGIKGQVLTGNDEPAEAIIEETLALGRRLGDPVVISIAMCNLTRELLRRGQWDELAKEIREHLDGTRRGTSATDGEPILHLALLAAWRGDHAEASRLVIEADERATDDPQATAAARTYELLIGRALGRPNPTFVIDVERHLDEVVAAFGWRSDNTPLLWPAGVDAALADGDLDGVERLLARLDALGPGHRPPFVSAYALRTRALLAVARSDDAADVEGLLRTAIEQLEDLGMLVHETTARLDLRDWLQAQGRAAEADEVAARCADQVRALGSVELLERL